MTGGDFDGNGEGDLAVDVAVARLPDAAGTAQTYVYFNVADQQSGLQPINLTFAEADTQIGHEGDGIVIGRALRFDGTASVIADHDESLDIRRQITVEAWVRVDDLDPLLGLQTIVQKGDGPTSGDHTYALFVRSDGSVVADTNTEPKIPPHPGDPNGFTLVSTPGLVEEGRWYHLALVVDREDQGNEMGAMRLYVNGRQAPGASGGEISTGNTRSNDDPLRIGTDDGSLSPLQGEIEEVRIWSEVRSPGQIAANMNRRLSGWEPNLAAYYRFEETVPGRVIDRSGNGNHGTLENGSGTSFVDVTAKLGRFPAMPQIDLNSDGFDDLLIGAVGARSQDEQRFGVGRIYTVYGSGSTLLPQPTDHVRELANRVVPGSGSFVERRAGGTTESFPAPGKTYELAAGDREEWFRFTTLGDGRGGDTIRLGDAGLQGTNTLTPVAQGHVYGNTVVPDEIVLDRIDGQTTAGILEFDLSNYLDLVADPAELRSAQLELEMLAGPTGEGDLVLFLLEGESDGVVTSADLTRATRATIIEPLSNGSGTYTIDVTSVLASAFAANHSRLTFRLRLGDAIADGPWQVTAAGLTMTRASGLVMDLAEEKGGQLIAGASAIDLRTVPAGTYFLRVATQNGQALSSARQFAIDFDAPNAGQAYQTYDRDTLRGGDGDDLLEGNEDYDHLFGESGTDAFIGESMEVHDFGTADLVVFEPDEGDETSPQTAVAPRNPLVHVPDVNLRRVLGAALGRPVDFDGLDFTASELASLVELDATAQGITDLTGIEHLVNLQSLVLNANGITDSELAKLAPLRIDEGAFAGELVGLSQLRRIALDRNPGITGIAPLADLPLLEVLSLDGTAIDPMDPVSSLEPLERLTELKFVSMPTPYLSSDHNLAAVEGESMNLTLLSGASWTVNDDSGAQVASGTAPNISFVPQDNGVFTLSVDGVERLPLLVANRNPEITSLVTPPSVPEGIELTANTLILLSGLSVSDAGAQDTLHTFVSVTDRDGDVLDVTNVSLEFDGQNDFVRLDEETVLGELQQNFTVAAWLNPSDLTTRGGILGRLGENQQSGWALEVTPPNSGQPEGLLFTAFGDAYSEFLPVSLPLNQWTHVAVSVDAKNSLRFFVGGQQQGAPRLPSERSRPTDVPFTIGGIAGLNSFFAGKLDDVTVFNRQLTEAEIASLQVGEVDLEDPNLVGLWQFNEAFGSIARDASISGHDGVLGDDIREAFPTWNSIDAAPLNAFTPGDDGTYIVRFTVVDDDGGFAVAETELQVTNQAPHAEITPETLVTTAGAPVRLSASASSDPGTADTLRYNWHVTTQTGQVVSDSDAVDFTLQPERAGFYDVTLTVTDSSGEPSTDRVTIQVAPQVSVAAPTGVLREGQLLRFAPTGSTPAAPLASRTYLWQVRDENTVVVEGTSRDFQFLPTGNGQFTVTLRITDAFAGLGAVTATSEPAVVIVQNAAPVVQLPATMVVDEGIVRLPIQVSDPGRQDQLTLLINWGDGSGFEPIATTGAGLTDLPTHTYLEAGSYVVTAFASDGTASSAVQTLQLTVNNVPPAKPFLTGPAAVADGELANFTAVFTDIGGDTHTATWDFGDGSAPVTQVVSAATAINRSHLYAGSGQYTVTLTITDSDGAADTSTWIVEVLNAAPTNLVLNASPIVEVGVATLFSGAVRDYSGDDLRATLSYGDGTVVPVRLRPVATTDNMTTYVLNASHAYQRPGSFRVVLTVTDEDGAAVHTDVRIRVPRVPITGLTMGEMPQENVGQRSAGSGMTLSSPRATDNEAASPLLATTSPDHVQLSDLAHIELGFNRLTSGEERLITRPTVGVAPIAGHGWDWDDDWT